MLHVSISTTSEHYMYASQDELISAMWLAGERWRSG